KALFRQLGGYPSALSLCAFLIFAMSLLPGIPTIPFTLLAAAMGGLAYLTTQARKEVAVKEQTAAADAAAPVPLAEEPIGTGLAIDLIRLELGYGLLSLINSPKGQRLTDQIRALRRQLATELGFIMPAVRIQDNLQLPANTYVIRIKEIEAGRG